MTKKHSKIALFVGVMSLALVGVGSVKALQLRHADEVQLKQQMKPDAVGDRAVDLVGIFPPGFDTDVASAKTDYEKEYGAGKFQVVDYKGYTIFVPPSKSSKDLADAEKNVDTQIASAQNDTPSAAVQASQIAKIREVFGTAGDIAYNSFMGAYTDDKGFQYNFYHGELMGKQVGVTNILAAKFASAYPQFKEGAVPAGATTLTEAQAKASADKVVAKVLGTNAGSVMAKASILPLGGPRLGITYGDNEVQVLVDTVSGDIIHYSKDK